jgi:putative FmdB family regulatory protein
MPMYDYRCAAGHSFERIAPISAGALQDCPACGEPSPKVPSAVSLVGSASPGLSMEQMPQTWKGTYGANREYVGQLRRQWDGRQKLEEKYPELKGDRRPILAHEGRYHDAPLRAGDAAASPTSAADHGHSHGPGHSHSVGGHAASGGLTAEGGA